MDELIPIERKDTTALAPLSAWVIYRLIREGKLDAVKVGRRRFLTKSSIAKFIASGGEQLGGP